MEVISEYFYCLIYVIALTIAVTYLLKEKVDVKRAMILVPLYAVINYFVTRKNSNIFLEYMVVNSLVLFLDYGYICLLFKKFEMSIVFYISMFGLFYVFTINSLIHIIDAIIGFNRQVTLICGVQRFIMIILINFLTVSIIVILDKSRLIPALQLINQKAELFIMLNILVYYTMTIIYNIGVVKLMNLITILVLLLLFLWLIFLKIMTMYIETTIKNEELLAAEISNKYIDKYVEFYKQESEGIRKLKHDLKNHQLVLENLDKMNQYTQYIDEVFAGINQQKYVSSGNIYLDACLYAKQQEYPDISFDYDIGVAGLVFNEKDLTSLLFNLIDNACNEAMMCDQVVSIKIKYVTEQLVIVVKNKCLRKPDFTSTKGSGHGYGMKIIKSIINKHDGDMYIDFYDGQVIFNIKLNV